MAYQSDKKVTLKQVADLFDKEIGKQLELADIAVKRGERRDAASRVTYLSGFKADLLMAL